MKLKRTSTIHFALLGIAIATVWLTQALPGWSKAYAQTAYPYISRVLSGLSGWIPFSLGDLFIFLSIVWVVVYPICSRIRKQKWSRILRNVVIFLAWVYVWFYLAWGLNYSQPHFYQRTGVKYTAYTPEVFRQFIDKYIEQLNAAYCPVEEVDKASVHQEVIEGYRRLGTHAGVHLPQGHPKVKRMMFTPLFAKMAVTGYMGPFFCEFNLNGDLLPSQYAETYAHELAHFLGIASEAEANFYAYRACVEADSKEVRYCGYFSVLNHVLNNAWRLLDEEEYKEILERIRPEIIDQARANRTYWMDKYSPLIGDIQSRIYDLYLKGNKIESGRKNYSEVVGLLISFQLTVDNGQLKPMSNELKN